MQTVYVVERSRGPSKRRRAFFVVMLVSIALFWLGTNGPGAQADTRTGTPTAGCVTRHVAWSGEVGGLVELRIQFRLAITGTGTVQGSWVHVNGTAARADWWSGPGTYWASNSGTPDFMNVFIQPGSSGVMSYVLGFPTTYQSCFTVSDVVVTRIFAAAPASAAPGGGGPSIPPSGTPEPTDSLTWDPEDPPAGWCWGEGLTYQPGWGVRPGPGGVFYPCEEPPESEAPDMAHFDCIVFVTGNGSFCLRANARIGGVAVTPTSGSYLYEFEQNWSYEFKISKTAGSPTSWDWPWYGGAPTWGTACMGTFSPAYTYGTAASSNPRGPSGYLTHTSTTRSCYPAVHTNGSATGTFLIEVWKQHPSPTGDSDSDGFTNQEEVEAGSDPDDSGSTPEAEPDPTMPPDWPEPPDINVDVDVDVDICEDDPDILACQEVPVIDPDSNDPEGAVTGFAATIEKAKGKAPFGYLYQAIEALEGTAENAVAEGAPSLGQNPTGCGGSGFFALCLPWFNAAAGEVQHVQADIPIETYAAQLAPIRAILSAVLFAFIAVAIIKWVARSTGGSAE